MSSHTAESAPAVEAPRVVHSLPGRIRVHLPSYPNFSPESVERHVRELHGVSRVRANSQTQNVLVHFDHRSADEHAILDALAEAARASGSPAASSVEPPPEGPINEEGIRAERSGHTVRVIGRSSRRARIAIRGLDRDPEFARRIVEQLSRLRGVSRVTASQLTGRVLVDYSEHLLEIEDILGIVSNLELPEVAGDETPSHPLDPAPLIQSTTRLAGAAFGLSLVAMRRAFAGPDASQPSRAASVAGAVGIIEGLPAIEQRLEVLLGPNAAQLALSGMTIVSLTFAGSPLGLAVGAAGALRLMTTVRARRRTWRQYEERLAGAETAHPGAEAIIEPGDRISLSGRVLRGFGTAISSKGEVLAAAPGERLDAGARVAGGPITVELEPGRAFVPTPRSVPARRTLYDQYLELLPPASLVFAGLSGVLTRSFGRALTGLLLVNPRAALIGAESANNGASARVMRQGVIVVGSREKHPIRRPDALILGSPRVLTAGLALAGVSVTTPELDESEVLKTAAAVSAAAGSPWGHVFGQADDAGAAAGRFDGRVASAEVGGERWRLGPGRRDLVDPHRDAAHVLELRRARESLVAGSIVLRLAPAVGLEELVAACRRCSVALEVAGEITPGGAALAQAAQISIVPGPTLPRVRDLQAKRAVVAVLSDSSDSAPELAECDLAIALSSGRSGPFAARADLLATDLSSVAAIVEAGTRRDLSVRDGVLASGLANVAGGIWGLGGNPRFARASLATYVAALGAVGSSYLRLRGGARARSVAERLYDPEPERFGRMSAEDALAALGSSVYGLASSTAASRRRPRELTAGRGAITSAIVDQLNSPLTGVLAGGAALSFALGAMGDVAMIGAVIAVNTLVGAWQEREAGRAAEALARMSARTATVVRDDTSRRVDADELVPGDIILLAPGDRVPADARLLAAHELEVDEAVLTGESVPVPKFVDGGTDASRIVLEGSDVTVGTGRAVVVGVGRGTRMGATAAAVTVEETKASPLGQKLGRMFSDGIPVIIGGGLLVTVAGALWGRPLLPQLALGASVAIGAVPEGLPLLAGVAQAAIARRLASNNALVRRLSAVEALGRVDVVCTDKTGTLTEGRPALTCVSDPSGECRGPEELESTLRSVLEAAALASPHPEARSLFAHPTDVAVVQGAETAGLSHLRARRREGEASFEPSRGFHATRSGTLLFVKGAPEVLVSRCTRVRGGNGDERLTEASRDRLLGTAERLSSRGLRVLMVAVGHGDRSIEDPHELTAIGYVGISDPLRPGVPAAVRRCEAAGVRVVMLTGDHPATASAIAEEAGLADNGAPVLTGDELGTFDDDELDRRLEDVRVIARISPLDKLRIVEALQRRAHVVAMTGDGVNDAPALRLADVGVAMGRSATAVAREAADVVLADDDFSTLVETFVEGRGFWHNIRRALGLLLGGNAGELGLMVAAGATGLTTPLTTRQVLAVNLVTDVLPAVSIAVQEPEHRNLALLSREGTAALDEPLRRAILRRGIATTIPAFVAYLSASRTPDLGRRRAVAFITVVGGQLAQTVDLGRAEGRLSPEVLQAVAASAAFVGAAVTFPPFQRFLGLGTPGPFGLALSAAAILASLVISRMLVADDAPNPTPHT